MSVAGNPLYYCEWCLYVLKRLRPGHHPHHVFGKHNPVTIRLCHEHHMKTYHAEGRITRLDIVEKILIPHYWNGEDRSATFAQVSKASRLSQNRKP